MTALLIIGIILAFFLFLLSLRATVTVTYSEELSLSVKVLWFRIKLLPKKKKRGPHSMSARKAKKIREKYDKKKEKKAQKAREKRKEKQEKKESEKKKSFSDVLSLLRLITSLLKKVLGKFFKHIRIDLKRLRITVATSDAATTAVAYGAVTGTISTLLPLIESAKQFSLPKADDLDVQVDFLSDSPSLDLHLSVSLRVWHALDIALGALVTFVKHKLKNTPAEEDGEEAEEKSTKGFPPSH